MNAPDTAARHLCKAVASHMTKAIKTELNSKP